MFEQSLSSTDNASKPLLSLLSSAWNTKSWPHLLQHALPFPRSLPVLHTSSFSVILTSSYSPLAHAGTIAFVPVTMCKVTAYIHTKCGHIHSFALIWACAEYISTATCASWTRPFLQLSNDTADGATTRNHGALQTNPPTKGVLQVPKYCKSCLKKDAALNIETAVREAGFLTEAKKRGWSKVRMESERYAFREEVRKEMSGPS